MPEEGRSPAKVFPTYGAFIWALFGIHSLPAITASDKAFLFSISTIDSGARVLQAAVLNLASFPLPLGTLPLA